MDCKPIDVAFTLCSFVYLFSVPPKDVEAPIFKSQQAIKNLLKLYVSIRFYGKADNQMSLLSLKATFDTQFLSVTTFKLQSGTETK